ncbi:MAG: DUF123 domain-containing protein [Candidatus Hodarchaeota archaeon]
MTKGIYALIIIIKENITLKIGKNRNYNFLPGYYIYIGSALGKFSTNIENRLRRHFSNNKKVFWHIDYLLNTPEVTPIKAFYAETAQKKECELSSRLKNYSDSDLFKDFGNSDCKARCKTHLFYFDTDLNLEHVVKSAFNEIFLKPILFTK